VPASSRTLGLLDNAALWGSLGFSLLLMVTGAFLTPALGLGQAVLVILIGAVIGNLMLATAAVIGADSGLPMVALLRAPLGGRGSYAASLLTLARNVAWGTFALMVMGEAAETSEAPRVALSGSSSSASWERPSPLVAPSSWPGSGRRSSPSGSCSWPA
jgi:purine-cytosine permease-like protein